MIASRSRLLAAMLLILGAAAPAACRRTDPTLKLVETHEGFKAQDCPGRGFSCQGHVATVVSPPLSYQVTLFSWPAGTSLRVGSQTAAVDAAGTASLKVSYLDRLGGLTLSDSQAVTVSPPEITVEVDHGAGHRASATFRPKPLHVAVAADDVVLALREGLLHGPVVFAAESGARAGSGCGLYLEKPSPVFAFVTAPCRLAEIDRVAVAEELESETGVLDCGDYRGVDGVGGEKVTIGLHETRVDLIDRRTGRVLETKTFPPVKACPSTVNTSSVDRKSSIPADAIKDWVRKHP